MSIEFENEEGLILFAEDREKLKGMASRLVRSPRGCPRQNQKAISQALILAYELGMINGRTIEGKMTYKESEDD